MSKHPPSAATGHERIETNNLLMIVLILLVVAIQKCSSIARTLCMRVWPYMRGIRW